MAHVVLNTKKLSKRLWAEAVNTLCHTINRVYFYPSTKKTPYELWKGKKPNVSYFHIFGSIFYIMNDKEPLSKFDAKSDTGVVLNYSTNSKACCVYNMRTQTINQTMLLLIILVIFLSFQMKKISLV